MPGAGEGGHLVVTLDPKEEFCRCGGRGHLEGIAGNRAMRMRFFDLEPEEVFAHAQRAMRVVLISLSSGIARWPLQQRLRCI
ncbi:MAG: ROK family protein [Blastocatellia bacterium]